MRQVIKPGDIVRRKREMLKEHGYNAGKVVWRSMYGVYLEFYDQDSGLVLANTYERVPWRAEPAVSVQLCTR